MHLQIQKKFEENRDRKGKVIESSYLASFQLTLNESESALIERFKLGGEPFLLTQSYVTKVNECLAGQTRRMGSVRALLTFEANLAEAAAEFAALLKALSVFDEPTNIQVNSA